MKARRDYRVEYTIDFSIPDLIDSGGIIINGKTDVDYYKEALDVIEGQRKWINVLDAEIADYIARIAELEAALKDTTVRLVAAISLLERGGKKAAPSNKMFEQMLVDYKNGVERARAALEKKND